MFMFGQELELPANLSLDVLEWVTIKTATLHQDAAYEPKLEKIRITPD